MFNSRDSWGFMVACGIVVYVVLRSIEWIFSHLHIHWSWL